MFLLALIPEVLGGITLGDVAAGAGLAGVAVVASSGSKSNSDGMGGTPSNVSRAPVPAAAADSPQVCMAQSSSSKREKGCQALRDSIINDCLGMRDRGAQARCFAAADATYRQCMQGK